MPTRLLIVFNPAAGSGSRRRLAAALDLLREAGLRPEVVVTTHPGHGRKLAQQAAAAGMSVVAAAGGDGTIAEVAAGLIGSETALGVLPFGTANVFAREIGLPLAPVAAAAILATGKRTLYRPGLAQWPDGRMRLFVQMLGAGFDAAVVQHLPAPLKEGLGRTAYVVQTLCEIPRYPFPPIRLRADEAEEETAASVIVSKGRFYGGPFLLAPQAEPWSESFELVLFRRPGPIAALLHAAALPLGLLSRLTSVARRRVQRVWLSGDAVPVQTDGDAAGLLPLRIEPAPAPLRLLLP